MIVVGISPEGQDAWGVDQVTVEDSFREELDMQLDPRKLPVIRTYVIIGIANVQVFDVNADCGYSYWPCEDKAWLKSVHREMYLNGRFKLARYYELYGEDPEEWT